MCLCCQDAANLLGADKDFGSLKDAANGEKEEIHEMPEVVKQQLLCQTFGMFLGAQNLGGLTII